MSAHVRTRRESVNRQPPRFYLGRMFYNQFFRSSKLALLLVFIALLVSVKHYLIKPSLNRSKNLDAHIPAQKVVSEKIQHKVVEVNDRQPSFKMYINEGYEVEFARHRAQAKLLDNLKLHDKCQQNSKTVVVDVGASLGQFGLYAAACGCQVYMFEVNPVKLALLQMSITLNSFDSRITLIRKAVTDLPPNTQFYIDSNTNKQVPTEKISASSNVFPVEIISLNDFNFSSEIYLLRVDVAGYEIHVFRASERLFRSNLVHHVLFQYNPAGTDRVERNDLLSYMRDILGGRRFYALHPKEAVLYGPIYNDDIDQFYTQHRAQNVERDVYVLFQDEELNIESKSYQFQSSF